MRTQAQFRRRASAVPNLIVIGSTVARHKHDSDPDVVPNSGLRPVPNVVLLPCRTQMQVSFRFRHGISKPFVTIRLGTTELGSARLLSTEGLAVPHGSSTTWFQTACYCRAELNS